MTDARQARKTPRDIRMDTLASAGNLFKTIATIVGSTMLIGGIGVSIVIWYAGVPTKEYITTELEPYETKAAHTSDMLLMDQRMTVMEESDKHYLEQTNEMKEEIQDIKMQSQEAVIILREMRRGK